MNQIMRVQLLEAMERETESIHQDAVNIFDNGLVNKNDVLSVELVQDQLSALRVKAANGCKLLRRALAKTRYLILTGRRTY